jgi:predicted cupin superfamily sugar epimerase
MDRQTLINRYGLQPHPEGGWYREVHRSPQAVLRADGAHRSGLTAILFLLEVDAVSRWHRVSQADETWHYAAGDPLELLLLPPQGGEIQRQRLGAVAEAKTDQPLAVVPAGWWQAARSLGAWTLVSCCVGPGFEFADFTLLRDLPEQEHPPGALADWL